MTAKGWIEPAFSLPLILDDTSLMPVSGRTTHGTFRRQEQGLSDNGV